MIDTIDKVLEQKRSGVPLANNAQDHGYSDAKINSFKEISTLFADSGLIQIIMNKLTGNSSDYYQCHVWYTDYFNIILYKAIF